MTVARVEGVPRLEYVESTSCTSKQDIEHIPLTSAMAMASAPSVTDRGWNKVPIILMLTLSEDREDGFGRAIRQIR